jgi:hypothetical protein
MAPLKEVPAGIAGLGSGDQVAVDEVSILMRLDAR